MFITSLSGGDETTKATIRFPLDKKLPVMLMEKLKVRVKKNDETEKRK
jgi:hypothetical protein